mgnify:CR=1 FL=1
MHWQRSAAARNICRQSCIGEAQWAKDPPPHARANRVKVADEFLSGSRRNAKLTQCPRDLCLKLRCRGILARVRAKREYPKRNSLRIVGRPWEASDIDTPIRLPPALRVRQVVQVTPMRPDYTSSVLLDWLDLRYNKRHKKTIQIAQPQKPRSMRIGAMPIAARLVVRPA